MGNEQLLLRRMKQYQHTLAERRIMGTISHPFLVWFGLPRRASPIACDTRFSPKPNSIS